MKALKSLIFCLIVFLGVNYPATAAPLPPQPAGVILYVKQGGTGNCSSWANACELQVALTAAGLIPTPPVNIWVAAGTYKPIIAEPFNRSATFELKSGVGIYGGFPPTGTIWEWKDRNWKVHITTLSGDLRSPTTINDNSYHVVTAISADSTAILDGFTITSGYADVTAGSNNYGGGLYINSSSPTLTNLNINGNTAEFGGGIYNNSSTPTLTNVTFLYNSATAHGGGMYNNDSSPTLTNVTFSYNSATVDSNGGGIYNRNNSNPTLINVTFSSNSATLHGGGMYNTYANPTLTNVTFSGNSAVAFGGAIYNDHSDPLLNNVTVSKNLVTDPSGKGGAVFNYASNPTLTNTIIWGNSPTTDQVFDAGSSTILISFSDIQGGFAGTGNINSDPLLGSLADNGGFVQTHALAGGSPAIDKGSPTICQTTDARGYPRPIDGDGNGTKICDMGAYEFDFSRLFLPLVVK